MTSRAKQKASATLKRWRADPVHFFVNALAMKTWEGQASIAQAMLEHNRVAVRSGQKTGKSTGLAMIALWWLLTKPRAKVYITAPSDALIRDAIWPELTKIVTGWEDRGLPGPIVPLHCLAVDPGTGLRLGDGRFIKARTTSVSAPARMAGRSGDQLLFIVDEASEYAEELWPPIFGNLVGGGSLLATGNPTQPSGTFFDMFHDKGPFWHQIVLRGIDTPNYIQRKKVIPGLATFEDIEQLKAESGGEDSVDYQVRVLGEFPGMGRDTIILLEWVEAAEQRWKAMLDNGADSAPAPNVGELRIGVDVARFGDDDSVVACVRGRFGWVEERANGFDGNMVAGMVLRTLRKYRKPGERVSIHVDETGNGSSVVDSLRRAHDDGDLDDFCYVVGITVSETADDEETYHSLRDQLWFAARDWVQNALLRPEKMLRRDLVTPKYGFDARGRRQVEQKEKMKRRLKRSPDAGDALCLAVYRSGSGELPEDDGYDEPLSRWEEAEDAYA